MIFDVERPRGHETSVIATVPGDLRLTRSPAGNGMHPGRFPRAGDVMDCEITGLGAQRNRCVTGG